jgi:hypothetical protein
MIELLGNHCSSLWESAQSSRRFQNSSGCGWTMRWRRVMSSSSIERSGPRSHKIRNAEVRSPKCEV